MSAVISTLELIAPRFTSNRMRSRSSARFTDHSSRSEDLDRVSSSFLKSSRTRTSFFTVHFYSVICIILQICRRLKRTRTVCFREPCASGQEGTVVALIISRATSAFFASFALGAERERAIMHLNSEPRARRIPRRQLLFHASHASKRTSFTSPTAFVS